MAKSSSNSKPSSSFWIQLCLSISRDKLPKLVNDHKEDFHTMIAHAHSKDPWLYPAPPPDAKMCKTEQLIGLVDMWRTSIMGEEVDGGAEVRHRSSKKRRFNEINFVQDGEGDEEYEEDDDDEDKDKGDEDEDNEDSHNTSSDTDTNKVLRAVFRRLVPRKELNDEKVDIGVYLGRVQVVKLVQYKRRFTRSLLRWCVEMRDQIPNVVREVFDRTRKQPRACGIGEREAELMTLGQSIHDFLTLSMDYKHDLSQPHMRHMEPIMRRFFVLYTVEDWVTSGRHKREHAWALLKELNSEFLDPWRFRCESAEREVMREAEEQLKNHDLMKRLHKKCDGQNADKRRGNTNGSAEESENEDDDAEEDIEEDKHQVQVQGQVQGQNQVGQDRAQEDKMDEDEDIGGTCGGPNNTPVEDNGEDTEEEEIDEGDEGADDVHQYM